MSENGEIYTTGKNFTLSLAVTAWTNSTSVPSCVDIFPKLICGPCGAPNLPRLLMMPIPNRSRSLNTHPLIDDFVRQLCGGAPVSRASLRTKDKQTLLAQGLRGLRWSQQHPSFQPTMTSVMSLYQRFNTRFRFTSLALYSLRKVKCINVYKCNVRISNIQSY